MPEFFSFDFPFVPATEDQLSLWSQYTVIGFGWFDDAHGSRCDNFQQWIINTLLPFIGVYISCRSLDALQTVLSGFTLEKLNCNEVSMCRMTRSSVDAHTVQSSWNILLSWNSVTVWSLFESLTGLWRHVSSNLNGQFRLVVICSNYIELYTLLWFRQRNKLCWQHETLRQS